MVTKQFSGSIDEAELTRADSLAREIFSDVANKWALLIIEALGERTLRFGELRNEIEGISHKMLTQNLRMLERSGLIEDIPERSTGRERWWRGVRGLDIRRPPQGELTEAESGFIVPQAIREKAQGVAAQAEWGFREARKAGITIACGSDMNPIAEAPSSAARSASCSLVIPQTLTNNSRSVMPLRLSARRQAPARGPATT